MRKLMFLFTMLSSFVSYGQNNSVGYIDGKLLSDIEATYVEVVATPKVMSSKLTINIDFGQGFGRWSYNQNKLVDQDGKKIEFESVVDALNWMYLNGYAVLNAYTSGTSNQPTYNYLLRKKKELKE